MKIILNFLMKDFKGCFDGVDSLILLPIYAAGETNIWDMTEEKLGVAINHNNIKY